MTITCSLTFLYANVPIFNYSCLRLIQGSRLDSYARYSLWEGGLDYRHGTGHGVGAFLNVHEGNNLSCKTSVFLRFTNMALSNRTDFNRTDVNAAMD